MFKKERELLSKKNVSVVFDGTRIKNGVDTMEPCVVVGVECKMSLNDIHDDDLIPCEIHGKKNRCSSLLKNIII